MTLQSRGIRKLALVGAAGALALALSTGGASAASSTVYVYSTDLDAQPYIGGSLDQNGPATLGGVITSSGNGLTLLDLFNGLGAAPPSSFTTTSNAVPGATSFAFEYTFSVEDASNTAGTYVSQLSAASDSIKGLGLALYAGSSPTLYGSQQALATGSVGAGSDGELVLNYSNLTGGDIYTLVVTGALNSVSAASFTGAAQVSPVPVPGAVLLFATGLLGLAAWAGRRRIIGFVAQHRGATATLALAAVAGAGNLAATPAEAATYTDIVSVGSITPSYNQLLLNTVINTKKATPLTAPGYGNVVTGSGTLSSFVIDYSFNVTGTSDLDAILSQGNTTVSTGSQFELFSGTPTPSNTAIAAGAPGTGSAAGELQISYANLTAGEYYIQITGALSPGFKSGTAGSILEVSPVPLPGAVILFGSAVAGVLGWSRRSRKRLAS